MEEIWKDIKGFEGRYQISNTGKVKSLRRIRSGPRGGWAILPERIMKLKKTNFGYLSCHLYNNGINKHIGVHRLVAENFLENPDNKPTVNHIDANKENNHVSNLEWATQSEQMKHALANNLLELRGDTKYSKEFKKEILQYYLDNDISISKLALKFGVSSRTAGRVVSASGMRKVVDKPVKAPKINVQDIITEEDVVEIKRLRSEGYTLSAIGKMFNRSATHIHRILAGKARNFELKPKI